LRFNEPVPEWLWSHRGLRWVAAELDAIFPGQGEGTDVLAARSGIGKTTVAVAAAKGLVCNGAGVLFLSYELSRRAIVGADYAQLQHWIAAFSNRQCPDGRPMGKLFYQSRFAASVEEISALVEDTKAAHPELSVVVLGHSPPVRPSAWEKALCLGGIRAAVVVAGGICRQRIGTALRISSGSGDPSRLSWMSTPEQLQAQLSVQHRAHGLWPGRPIGWRGQQSRAMERSRLGSMQRERTAALLAHLLVSSRELLQNMQIDRARRPRLLMAAGEPDLAPPGRGA
jgi:hypothetical protein